MTLNVEIAIESDAWDKADDLESMTTRAILTAGEILQTKLREGAEVSVLFTNDVSVRALNKAWRKQDKPTNVLSFPAAKPGDLASAALLGDIILAFETISAEADEQGKSLSDHVTHLVVHGFLHLLGHDHEVEDEAVAMEASEVKILAKLGIADPYAEPASQLGRGHEL